MSAILWPSRRLRCLRAALCAALVATALVVGVFTPERFAFDGLVAFAPLAGALVMGCSRAQTGASLRGDSQVLLPGFGTPRRLDISGLGQLHLTVQQEMRAGGAPDNSVSVTLLPGAVVWPHCMLLRLRAADGATTAIVLLADSMAAGEFRQLAVAVRALANGTAAKKSIQIL